MSRKFVTISIIVLALGCLISVSLAPTIQADGGANHQTRNMHFGVSGGNVNDESRRFCCSGTLGSLVQDSGGTNYILSNNHVLGLAGKAHVGDDISQPGLVDFNCNVADVVADFSAAPSLNNNVDAAVAALRTGMMDGTGFIEDIGTISSVVKAPSVTMSVAKSGRTTGSTTGSIQSINTNVSVRYPKSCGAGGGTVHTFTGQVVVTPGSFSAGGDSGSLIVTNNSCHQPVALLFAGSSSSTIGNPIGSVLTQVGSALGGTTVTFVGGTCSASALLESQAAAGLGGPSDQSVEFALNVMKGRVDQLMARPGVIGVGVGVSDLNPNEAAIVIYLDQNSLVTSRTPRWIDGVRVVRVFTDEFVAR
ncbi:MAG TPA: hypothetical protein VFV34_01860 [Blastocatellia bacterium]|nr:hypothetical protein [Blastocatellia bacterium]